MCDVQIVAGLDILVSGYANRVACRSDASNSFFNWPAKGTKLASLSGSPVLCLYSLPNVHEWRKYGSPGKLVSGTTAFQSGYPVDATYDPESNSMSCQIAQVGLWHRQGHPTMAGSYHFERVVILIFYEVKQTIRILRNTLLAMLFPFILQALALYSGSDPCNN